MLYELFRLPLIALFFSYYRRIYLANIKKVPKGQPIIIISNHSTAFVEQMLVSVFLKQGVYFWARSSVFPNNPVINGFMRSMHMLPIKREEEGMKDPRENDRTIQSSYKHILNGKALYIAPEGNCVMEKRLRPLRSGAARVALGAAATVDFKKTVSVVPVGVNYTHHRAFRSDVMISFGDPILVSDYEEEFRKDPQRAARLLTAKMREALLKEVISINAIEDEPLTERLFEIYRNELISPIGPRFSRNNERLRLEQQIAQMVNNLAPEPKANLAAASAAYFEELRKNGLCDAMFAMRQKLSKLENIVIFVGALPALLGFAAGYLPLNIAKYYRNKMMTTEKMLQFHAPLAIALSLVSWLVYGLIAIGSTAWYMGWWSIGLPPAMAALQYWQICYRDYSEAWNNRLRFLKTLRKNPTLIKKLMEQRGSLVASSLVTSEQCFR